MQSYPADFAGGVKSLANQVHLWSAAQAESNGEEADARFEEAESIHRSLAKQSILSQEACQQLHDMAVSAAAVTLSEVFGMEGADERREDYEAAREPQPDEVTADLWQRTQALFWAAAKLACSEASGDEAAARKHQRAFDRHARYIAGFGKVCQNRGAPSDPRSYAAKAAQVIPATVIMFSGCKDSQTSADVQNTESFGLPDDAGPGGAGGACTNSMIKALAERSDYSWIELLQRMQDILRGTYTQVPQLSSSRQIDLSTPFGVTNPEGTGKCRALLIGINYVGSSCELQGCHNDVETMRRYLVDQGYSEDDMQILLDDGEHTNPDMAGIISAIQWLVDGAEAGDSLFFHYSGHGASVRDDNGEEADGKDECLCPVDYDSAGLFRDDDVFKYLVGPLREGVHLTAVLDCCHSGTILDLPYMFKADDASLQAAADGQVTHLGPNGDFDFGKVLQIIQEHPGLCVAAAVIGGVAFAAMGKERRSQLGGMLMDFAQQEMANGGSGGSGDLLSSLGGLAQSVLAGGDGSQEEGGGGGGLAGMVGDLAHQFLS